MFVMTVKGTILWELTVQSDSSLPTFQRTQCLNVQGQRVSQVCSLSLSQIFLLAASFFRLLSDPKDYILLKCH
jgi:hypothetical protein